MPYLETRGPVIGRCNICAETKKLTADHVPPKGVTRFKRMELNNIMESLSADPPKERSGRIFQNGVKFRTICKSCNSGVLGALYDPELVNFSNSVSRHLHAQIKVPSSTTHSVAPGLVVRSVLGHILALGVEHFPRGEMGEAAAELVLNPTAPIPEQLNVHYWLYPYWDQISVRGIGKLLSFGTPVLVVSLLKFTPLAFMVSWDPDPRFTFPHHNLCHFIIGDGAHKVEVPLSYRNFPDANYPETPGDDGVILSGETAYRAVRSKSES